MVFIFTSSARSSSIKTSPQNENALLIFRKILWLSLSLSCHWLVSNFLEHTNPSLKYTSFSLACDYTVVLLLQISLATTDELFDEELVCVCVRQVLDTHQRAALISSAPFPALWARLDGFSLNVTSAVMKRWTTSGLVLLTCRAAWIQNKHLVVCRRWTHP